MIKRFLIHNKLKELILLEDFDTNEKIGDINEKIRKAPPPERLNNLYKFTQVYLLLIALADN